MAQLSVVFYTQMATITLNEDAPEVQEDSPLSFSFGNNEPFQLSGPDSTFESDDRDFLASAAEHPWLKVTYAEPEQEQNLAGEQQTQQDQPFTLDDQQPVPHGPEPTATPPHETSETY